MDWNYLESCWRDAKQKQDAEKRLAMEIHGTDNPYQRTANMLDQCLRHMKGKPSKTPLILLTILEKQQGTSKAQLTYQVQEAALNAVLRQRNSNIFNKVCQLYCLSDNSMDFLPFCQALVTGKKYNEACLLATALKLQEYFTIQDIIIPLFLQDKFQNAEHYLKGYPDLQTQFMQFLDGLLMDSRKPLSVASSLCVHDVKSEKLKPKTIGKLLARLLKLYDIPPETCPNLCKVRGVGALKYLVNRRFSEGTVDDVNWSDLLLGTVGDDRELQKELLSLLVRYNVPREALKWALHFKVERQFWPPVLEELLIQQSLDQKLTLCDSGNSLSSSTNVPEEENVQTKDGKEEEEEPWEPQEPAYLSFRLNRSDIVLVKTLDEFLKCISDIQSYDVVALDGEWKPSFGMQQERLSLLQLAVWDSVYLLDVLSLQGMLEQSHWKQLIDQVICNPHINKLSYGFTSDIQQLCRIVPTAKAELQKIENMFDFAILYPKFHLHCPDLLTGCPENSSGRMAAQESKGLSNLTLSVLGFPLDKSMQFSDWDKRPLREPQVLYAALDAYCLLQIYEVWYKRASELGHNFFETAKKAKSSVPPSNSPQKGKTSKEKSEVPLCEQMVMSADVCDPSRPTMSIADLKVVVDTMLQGLGKHLRVCGVDTHILETEDYHDEAAKVAQREGRVILTSGAPYQQLKQHVPAGQCLNLPNSLTSQEQAQILFRHFNVQLQKEDIFSRCCVCNGAQYVHIPGTDLQQMWLRNKKPDWGAVRQPHVIKKYPGGTVNFTRALIENRVSIRLHQLSQPVFERNSLFFVCANCGKVYWEGSHHGRVMRKLQPLISHQESQNAPSGTHEVTNSSVSTNSEMSADAKNAPNAQSTSTCSKSTLPPPPEMYLNSDDEDDNDDYYCY